MGSHVLILGRVLQAEATSSAKGSEEGNEFVSFEYWKEGQYGLSTMSKEDNVRR